jgi:hypothetical protein
MTAYKTRLNGRTPATRNKKDGATGRRPSKRASEASDKAFEAAGFRTEWIRGAPRMTYTWKDGTFPKFEVCPGIITDTTGTHAGLVAKHAQSQTEILFRYGTNPAVIAARLDTEILRIKRADAADNEPINWDEWKSEGLAYDF